MPRTNSLPLLHDTGRTRWQNWHENFEQPLHKLFDVWNAEPNRSSLGGYNGTTKGLQTVIAEAADADRSVRALGGGWSFSHVAATDGILLNTRPLNYRFPLSAGEIDAGYKGTGTLLFVQCGISIADLNSYLASKDLALRTSGASNGQTIAGALSTGTHGAAIDVGAVQDYVVAIHLVTEPGQSVWLERKAYPVVDQNIPKHVHATLKRDDDDLFNAAAVSFGSFGIIHGVVIEVDPLYYLNAWRKRIPINQDLWDAISAGDFSKVALPGAQGRKPYHVQFVLNPYDLTQGAFTTVMYREPTCPQGSKPPKPGGKISQGDGALEMVARLTDFAGSITPDLSKILTKLGYADYQNICGTPGQMFKDTSTRGRAASTAMGIPLAHVQDAVDIANRLVAAASAPALVAMRFVKASQATLAFTRHKPMTCVLEIDGPESNRVKQVYREVWQAFDDANIPYTFHWGKMNNLDAANVRKMYGDAAVDKWLDARRKLLPTKELRRAFANDFTDRLGLSD